MIGRPQSAILQFCLWVVRRFFTYHFAKRCLKSRKWSCEFPTDRGAGGERRANDQEAENNLSVFFSLRGYQWIKSYLNDDKRCICWTHCGKFFNTFVKFPQTFTSAQKARPDAFKAEALVANELHGRVTLFVKKTYVLQQCACKGAMRWMLNKIETVWMSCPYSIDNRHCVCLYKSFKIKTESSLGNIFIIIIFHHSSSIH